MQHERNRLASFAGLPEHIPIIASLLATAGFYRSKNPKRRDEVVCFSCGCRLSDWSSEDDHHERHREVSPRCPMVTDHSAGRRLAGNVPFGTEPPGDLGEPPGDLESWNTYSSTAQNTGVTSHQNPSNSCHQHHNTASYPHAGFDTSSAASENNSPPTSTSGTAYHNTSPPTSTNAKAYHNASPPTSTSGTAYHNTSPPTSTSATAYLNTSSFSHNSLSSILDRQRSPETYSQRDHRLKLLKRESARLQTFTTWAECAPVDKHLVARAGFYYIGPGDRVRCAFCYNVLRMWEEGDIPEQEHKKYFPRCPFVMSPLTCGNVLVEDDHAPLPPPSVVQPRVMTSPSGDHHAPLPPPYVVQPRVMTSPSGPRTANLHEQGPRTNGVST